jgi:hypothetical protein
MDLLFSVVLSCSVQVLEILKKYSSYLQRWLSLLKLASCYDITETAVLRKYTIELINKYRNSYIQVALYLVHMIIITFLNLNFSLVSFHQLAYISPISFIWHPHCDPLRRVHPLHPSFHNRHIYTSILNPFSSSLRLPKFHRHPLPPTNTLKYSLLCSPLGNQTSVTPPVLLAPLLHSSHNRHVYKSVLNPFILSFHPP